MKTRKPTIKDLHIAVSKVCPIDGVSLKDGVVTVQHKPEATPAQKGLATKLINKWDWEKEIEREPTLEERVAALEEEVRQLKQQQG